MQNSILWQQSTVQLTKKTKYPFVIIGHVRIYCPNSILSYDLCFRPRALTSRYALTIKQTTKNNFQKRTRYTKIDLKDQAMF